MDDEMSSLMTNDTWTLVTTPKDCKLIACKMVCKLKDGVRGVYKPRSKARLVAKGFTQREGIVYIEVFSSVIKHTSIRTLLSLVVHFDLELY